jgi:hypothetical protein
VQTLQYTTNASKAIVPAMKWLDSIAPQKPTVNTQKIEDGTLQLSLQQKSIDATCFVIYRFDKTEKIDITNALKIEAIQNGKSYITKQSSTNYKYVVTSLDKIHNESDYTIAE